MGLPVVVLQKNLDEPYEAESPVKTPPDVSFHDSDADYEADKPPAAGLGAVASIACDAAASLPQEEAQSMFQGSFDQGGQVGCLGAAAAPEKKAPKRGRGKHSRIGKDVLFEFACAKDSNPGKVGHENGLRVIRLCKEDINLEDPHSIEQLIAQVSALEGCSIHGSIECRPWSLEPMATLKPDKVSKTGSKDHQKTSRECCLGKAIHSGG